MSGKFLRIFLFIFILFAVVLAAIFVRISKHTGRTIAELREQHGPERIAVTEISLVRKMGWELFADVGEVRDIVLFQSNYYLATAGGIVVSEENGKVIRILNTTWGLPENSYRQLLAGEEGVYALSQGGVLLQIRKDNALLYDLTSIGTVFSIAGEESDIHIGGDKGVYILRDDELSLLEDIERVNIVKPFMNGVAIGTTHGTAYVFTPTKKDTITGLDAVNDLWEHGNILHIATPLGVVKVGEQGKEEALAGEFLTTIAEMGGTVYYGTFDGRVIVGERINRITRKDEHVNRLRLLDGRFYACTSEGAYILDGERWKVFYRPRADVPLEYITTLHTAGDELLIGTFEDGSFRLRGQRLYRIELGDDVNEINQIVHGGQSLFFATNSGLFEMTDNGIEKREGLPSLFVNSITAFGKSVVAGTSRGFCVMDRTDLTVRNYGAYQGLINNRVYAVAATDEKIVLGTLGGISIFDGKKFLNITSANSELKNNWVNGLQSAGEKIYVGTYGGGVGCLEEKGIWLLEETEGVEVNGNGLFYRKPFLFAGTCNRGLFVYDERNERGNFLTGIFPLDNVTAVCADGDYYYIGTPQGVYRIEAKEFSFL
jgi:hypothetical protein